MLDLHVVAVSRGVLQLLLAEGALVAEVMSAHRIISSRLYFQRGLVEPTKRLRFKGTFIGMEFIRVEKNCT